MPTGGAGPHPAQRPDAALFREGELSVIGRISTASNLTLVCDIPTGDSDPLRVVYKPVRGERPLWDFPDGTLAGREVASYRIAAALGWPAIPETILREGPFGPGMVQRWIDTGDHAENTLDLVDLCPPGTVPDGFREVLRAVDPSGAEVSLVHSADPRLHRLAVLDVLLNNADRKGGHALAGTDGRHDGVYGVDHGICLHHEPKLRTVLWGWAGEPVPEDLLTDIAAFLKDLPGDLATTLAEHLTDPEIDALADRARRLLDHPVMPLPDSARPIPWPAF